MKRLCPGTCIRPRSGSIAATLEDGQYTTIWGVVNSYGKDQGVHGLAR
jgi:hypothetical protein